MEEKRQAGELVEGAQGTGSNQHKVRVALLGEGWLSFRRLLRRRVSAMTLVKLICWLRGHAWTPSLDWGEGRMETCARCKKVRIKRNAAGLPPAWLWDVP